MKKYRLSEIEWDTSDEEYPDGRDFGELGLPSEVFIKIDTDDIFNPAEDSADWLSDNYGFCVWGCNFEEIE